MGKHVRDVLHEHVFGFHVVKAEQSQVLVYWEQQKSMYFWDVLFLSNDLDVLNQRSVNTLGHVELLEQIVVFLSLVVKLINYLLVKHFLVHVHKTFNVFETHIVLKSSCQKEKILDYTWSLILFSSKMVIRFENGISKGFVSVSIVFDDDVVLQHSKFISHELQVGIHFT